MRLRFLMLAAAVMATAGAASAEVIERRDDGFRLRNSLVVEGVNAAAAWAALSQPGQWWDPAHTYSGDAANMTLELRPGACFCETLPDGGVEHGRVLLAWPAQGLLRLEAALGPLQGEGLSAVLTWQVSARAAGGVEIVQTYNIGGAAPAAVEWAEAVDGVMRTQLERLGAHLEARADEQGG